MREIEFARQIHLLCSRLGSEFVKGKSDGGSSLLQQLIPRILRFSVRKLLFGGSQHSAVWKKCSSWWSIGYCCFVSFEGSVRLHKGKGGDGGGAGESGHSHQGCQECGGFYRSWDLG